MLLTNDQIQHLFSSKEMKQILTTAMALSSNLLKADLVEKEKAGIGKILFSNLVFTADLRTRYDSLVLGYIFEAHKEGISDTVTKALIRSQIKETLEMRTLLSKAFELGAIDEDQMNVFLSMDR